MTTSISTVKYLSITDIIIDGNTQSRVKLNWDVVAEYAEAMKSDIIFPPIVVFYDGKNYWLADGFHRFHAAKKAECQEIAVDLHLGARRDALLYSVGANVSHGLRRTNADKRRAVEKLLQDEEWSQWSNREIAKRCGVSEFLVRQVRETICDRNANSKKRIAQRQGTIYSLDTTNIGDSKIPEQIPESKELHISGCEVAPVSNNKNSMLVEQSHAHQQVECGSYIAPTTEIIEPQEILANKVAMEIRHLSPEQLAQVIALSVRNGLSKPHLKAIIAAAQHALY